MPEVGSCAPKHVAVCDMTLLKLLYFRLATIQQNSAGWVRIKTITFVYSLPKNNCRPSCTLVGGRGRFWSNLSTWGASFKLTVPCNDPDTSTAVTVFITTNKLTCWLFVTEPNTGDPKTSRHCTSAALHPSTDKLCPGETTTQTVPTYVQTWQIQSQQYFWHMSLVQRNVNLFRTAN
jgi:hypothetical protein